MRMLLYVAQPNAFKNGMSQAKPHQKQRHLAKNSNPHEVRDSYLLRALALLSRHGHLRTFGLAFGLFPDRTRPAAVGAATRVIANGLAGGLLAAFDDPITRHRFYALTGPGARYLKAADIGYDHVSATTYTLPSPSARAGVNPAAPSAKKGMRKWRHREWASLIAMASDQRKGFVGIAELELLTKYRNQLIAQFSYRVPDALFVCPSKGSITWHEVETSRRARSFGKDKDKQAITSKTVRLENGKDHTQLVGTEHVIELIQMLRSPTRRLVCKGADGDGRDCYVEKLVFHTANNVIFNELNVLLKAKYIDNYTDGNGLFALPWLSASETRVEEKLIVCLIPLPASPEQAWPVPHGPANRLPEPNLAWARKASVESVQDRVPQVKLAKVA